jgi:hypothetical protein
MKALDAYRQSLRNFEKIGRAQNQAILYHAVGGVHCATGSNEEALSGCRRTLAIYRDIGDLPTKPMCSMTSARSIRTPRALTRP